MQHVIDIGDAGTDASVLTDSGSGGLIGRGTLADGPLADRIDDAETPRFVLRNKKRGFTVERPADGADDAGDDDAEFSPDRNHTGVVLVTDVRLLFAVGRGDGDRTASVDLSAVVDVRTEDGLLGNTFVVDTVADAQYRFPCRGDLEPVAEFVDAAVGIWTRSERRLERADAQVDRLREAFESGDTDVVLAATGDVTATLDDARSEASAFDGAAERIDARARALQSTVDGLERRAHAERAEQARERAHIRWDDHEYEAAFDHFDDAADAYAEAVATDGDTPSDDLLSRRREALADERDRLAAAPLERADHAADVAATTDDPGAAIDWWESAVERYETALSLDWGRDDRRFEGSRERIQDDLALAARNLVDAHCVLARDHLADGDEDRESNPEAAVAAYDLAADALDAARTVAEERAPDAMDDIEQVASALESRRDEVSIPEEASGAEVDGGQSPSTDLSTRQTVVDPASPDGTGDADSTTLSGTAAKNETGRDASTGETGTSGDGEPSIPDPSEFLTLVSDLFEQSGWSTTVFESSTAQQYDILAVTGRPVSVAACVWTVHPDETESVDAATVGDFVSYLARTDEADVAVVCSAAPLSPSAREKATDHNVKLLDRTALNEGLADSSLERDAF